MFDFERRFDWRNTKKEGYIQISRFHYVKEDTFDYFTEKDLLERVSEKHGVSIRECEDLYKIFMDYFKNIIEKQNDDDKGYYVPYLAYFLKRKLHAEDLTKGRNTLKYIKAKKQLDLYMKLQVGSIGVV